MGVSRFGSFFCLWAVCARSNRWRTLIGSWVTPPTTGSIKIKLGGSKNITINHGSGGADCGRRRSWPLPPPRKMCVRYTPHRKRGLVAASKRMQAEGMMLGELCVTTPPPCRKINPKSPLKNEEATPCPGRFSPNPIVLRLIVKFSAILTGRIVQFRPPGRKMKAIPPPPPPTNIADFPSWTPSHCALPLAVRAHTLAHTD